MGDFDSLIAFANKYGQSVVQASGIAPGFQATKASVVDSFLSWSGPLEGKLLSYPYTDVDGWVTTGTGNLIDAGTPGQSKKDGTCGKGTGTPCGQATPTAKARSLPWSPNNIDADWAALKSKWPGVQSTACAGITSSRLTQDFLANMAMDQLKANERDVLKLVPGFAQIPADAQLALHSMMWAMGSGALATYKTLLNAVNSGDFATAAAQSHMKGDGIDMRNLANKLLFTNASKPGIDPDHLYYLELAEGVAGSVASTLPVIGPLVAAGQALTSSSPGAPSVLDKFTALPMWERGLIIGGVVIVSAGVAFAFVSLMESEPTANPRRGRRV